VGWVLDNWFLVIFEKQVFVFLAGANVTDVFVPFRSVEAVKGLATNLA
jgi:hypothetical protein